MNQQGDPRGSFFLILDCERALDSSWRCCFPALALSGKPLLEFCPDHFWKYMYLAPVRYRSCDEVQAAFRENKPRQICKINLSVALIQYILYMK